MAMPMPEPQSSGGMEAIFERVSIPYLTSYLDNKKAALDTWVRLRREWFDLEASERRDLKAVATGHWYAMLIIARATASNMRIPLDRHVDAAVDKLRTKYQLKIVAATKKYSRSSQLNAKIRALKARFWFDAFVRRIEVVEAVMQPHLFVTPSNPGEDLFDVLMSDLSQASAEDGLRTRRLATRKERAELQGLQGAP